MPYNSCMNPDTDLGYPGYERELDSLQASYGSETFTRSLLQVYARDCPAALSRLNATIDDGNLEAAKTAIHSLANIMGVVGPAVSRPLIETISADLKAGRLDAAGRHARDLESMINRILVSIRAWLDKPLGPEDTDGNVSESTD